MYAVHVRSWLRMEEVASLFCALPIANSKRTLQIPKRRSDSSSNSVAANRPLRRCNGFRDALTRYLDYPRLQHPPPHFEPPQRTPALLLSRSTADKKLV